MEKSRFGAFVYLLRQEKGLTQKELADALNVTDKAVSRWENGRNYPDIEIMQKMARFFGVSINELLQGERIPEASLKSVSDRNLVTAFKRLKQNRNRYAAVMSILVTIIVILVCLFYTPLTNMLHGVKATKLEVTSNDAAAILSCVDGYITSETGAPAQLYEAELTLYGDKTVEDLYIGGASAKGTTFFCSVIKDMDNFPYVYIHEDKEEVQVDTNITSANITDFIDVLDLQQLDSDWSPDAKYLISIMDIRDENYVQGPYEDNKTYIYDVAAMKLIEVKKGDTVEGPYAYMDIFKYDKDGTGTSFVHVLWPM